MILDGIATQWSCGFTLISGWYIYHLIEYAFHKLGHYNHPYNYIYYLHKLHHTNYPMWDLISPEYRGRKEGLIAYSIPSIFVSITLYLFLSYRTFIVIVVELVCLMIISDIIHTQIHTSNSWLERFDWFKENRRLHFIHHRRLDKNLSFAGLSHSVDKTLGTFKNNI